MNIKFNVGFPPINEEQVLDLEAVIGYSLPDDYREFLLKFNGGRQPRPECFKVDTGEISMLSVLYPIGKSGDFYDLGTQFVSVRDSLPDGVVPIGLDLGGNVICLVVAGEGVGSILFWEHEVEIEGNENVWGGLFFCSRSFTEFVESLHEMNPQANQ